LSKDIKLFELLCVVSKAQMLKKKTNNEIKSKYLMVVVVGG